MPPQKEAPMSVTPEFKLMGRSVIPVTGFSFDGPEGPSFIRPGNRFVPVANFIHHFDNGRRIIAASFGGYGRTSDDILKPDMANLLTNESVSKPGDVILVFLRNREPGRESAFRTIHHNHTSLVQEYAMGIRMLLGMNPDTQIPLFGHSNGAPFMMDIRNTVEEMITDDPFYEVNFYKQAPLLIFSPARYIYTTEDWWNALNETDITKGIFVAYDHDDIAHRGDFLSNAYMVIQAKLNGSCDFKNHVAGLKAFMPAIQFFMNQLRVQSQLEKNARAGLVTA
jgi:hypothetical protein